VTAPLSFDAGLLALSVVIAMISAYAAFEITDRIRVSTGTMQVVWVVGGASTMGVSFWAAQYIGMLAFGMPQSHFYFVVAQLSRILSIIVSGLALYAAALSPLDRFKRLTSGIAIAVGIVFAHAIAIASTAARPSRISIDWRYVLLEFAITTTFATVCLNLALRLRTLTGRRAFGTRLIAALFLATSISLLLFTGRRSLPVAYIGSRADLVQLDHYLIAIIAIVGCVLSIASIAAARVDRRIRGERARSRTLEDLYTRQKRTALALQRALLPSDPPIVDGVTFSWSYVPSTVEDGVGGDWFDAFVLEDGRVALSIGDAAGHDTQAVIAMNIARQALRNAALDHGDPSSVLAHVNRVLLHANHPSLVTAVYGLLDPMTLSFEYACAGHPPPVRARAGTRAAMIDGIGTGIPLGLFADAPATTQVLDLFPEDMLVFFTDGVIERERDLITGIASLERAADVLAATGAPDTAALLDRAIFGNGPRPDDAAIMTVRLEPALREIDLRVPAVPKNVGRIRAAMRRFIDSLDTTEDVAYAILLASGEAVANAVEHAYAGEDEPGDLVVCVRSDGDEAEVVIEDFGRWARGSSDPERGRGVALMHELASAASIEQASSGTIVRLNFSLVPHDAPKRDEAVTAPR
jgi:NO-binding membrane sensor protein with MHYT domain/anti-sigma regulatory factor (Ser/Thr protein kinase)